MLRTYPSSSPPPVLDPSFSSPGRLNGAQNGAGNDPFGFHHAMIDDPLSMIDWIIQTIEHLKLGIAAMDAKMREMREMQDMTRQMQYAFQTQTTGLAPFSPSTNPTMPFFPTNVNIPSPYYSYEPSQANVNSLHLQDHFTPNFGAPSPHYQFRSAASPTLPMANDTQSQLPTYTTHIRAGRKVYLCECGHETRRKGDMTRHFKTLKHSERCHTCCRCRETFTREDALKRHDLTCYSAFA